MVKIKENIINQKFGHLKVLYQTEDYIIKDGKYKGKHIAMFHCICDCGKEVDKTKNSIKTSTSCGFD